MDVEDSMEAPLLTSNCCNPRDVSARTTMTGYSVDDEETGMLVPKEAAAAADEGEHASDAKKVVNLRQATRVFADESGRLWRIATPIVFSILCTYGMNSAVQIFAGHLGNLQLSAVAIGLSVIQNFSFGFLLGMASALETLCGQAYGSGQVAMLGVYLQRSWIILFVAAVCLCPLYIFATPVLILLGQDEEIAVEAGKFAVSIIPQMFALAANFPVRKFLQAQSRVFAVAWIGLAALIIHIGLLALFISVFGWGIAGAGLAYDISSWLIAVAQMVYVVGYCNDAWTGLTWDAFKDIWAFVKLSVASAVMLCLEIWYMMVLIVLTGHLGNATVAVDSLSICMNINGWEGMLFIGINAAVSVRVSNELGSGRPTAAMYSVIVVLMQALLIGIIAMVAVLTFHDNLSFIYTNDPEVRHAVAKIAHLLAVTMVLNSIQPVIAGVAVGGGWQTIVAYINLGCYYGFGLPLGLVFGYVLLLGVQGIWAGMLCGTALQTTALLYLVWRTDWKAEAAQALERVRLWGGQNGRKQSSEHEQISPATSSP